MRTAINKPQSTSKREGLMTLNPISQTQELPTWPVYGEEMIQAVEQILRSGKVNYWTGSHGREFEEEFAEFVGTKRAIAVANGTLALELALMVSGVERDDEVIVPCRTFIASASAVVARGAKPVVVDVDADSQTLTAETIRTSITARTKAIIAVHLAGWPCDMDPILALARERDLVVIEDCAQAHGATYKGRAVGSLGDIGAFSFCQDKIISTGGEGGMLTTNDEDVWHRAWSYKDHGKRPSSFYSPEPSQVFQWIHDGFGSNYRMTEMQSAIGRIALRQLPAWLEQRRRNAECLSQCCRRLPLLRTPMPPAHIGHAWYKFYTFLREDLLAPGWTRDRIVSEIRSRGVPCFSGSCSEIYREQAFPVAWKPEFRLPTARQLGDTSLMFLVHPTLTELHLERASRIIRDVIDTATCSSYWIRSPQNAA
jgi:dTDP-4-amino-4,6-dideoxygalactose transaminase